MPNPSGYPAFVWLLRRFCPSEGNTSARRCSAQNSRVAVTPIKLTTMHKWANPTLTFTSCHVYRGDKCHAHPKQALSTARQQGRGVLEPLYTTTSASSSWSRPRNICSACLSRWHLPRRSPPFIWLGHQPPKNVGSSGQQMSWHRVESAFFLRHGEQTTTGLAFDSRMLKLKMAQRGRAGCRGGARVSSVDCARSPYGESTFKRNRPSFAVLMVLGEGALAKMEKIVWVLWYAHRIFF